MSWLSDELLILARARYKLVLIVTHEEERALAATAAACSVSNLKHQVWTLTQGLVRTGGLEETPAKAATARDAIHELYLDPDEGVVVLVDVVPFLKEDRELVRTLRDFSQCVTARKAIWMISPSSDLPPELEKETTIIDLPLPTAGELRHGLDQVCAEEELMFPDAFLDALVRAAGGLTLAEAQRVFRKALVKGGGHRLDDVHTVIDLKRQILRRGSILEAYPLDWTLADVGGLDELKRWLDERQQAFTKEAREFGLPEPRGLLLMGVQGCGKSLSAKAVAGLWKLPLLRLDLAELFGATHPESELRGALKVAEAMSPAVLWIDELDKAFDLQATGTSGRILGTIITWLQEKLAPVFVVATANEVDRLPPELTRRGRFDAVFFVDLPNVHERKEILALHLEQRGRNPNEFDLDKAAKLTRHYAGSELEQIVVGALYRAFARHRELDDQDLEDEASEMVPMYATYEEKIKKLRQWARGRARSATLDRSKLDLFEKTEPSIVTFSEK